jgi:RimJ/RimL family protein N-acetyltransferase
LLRDAVEAKLVRPEMAEIEGRLATVGSPDMHAKYVLKDGTRIDFRPTHPTDEPRMKDLFYDLSQQTVYYRFMRAMKSLPEKTLLNMVFVDHRHDVAIVGTVPEASGEEIIAVGRYYLDPKTNRAEVAFTVRDGWQNRGIGAFLLKMLTTIARRNGIGGFTAEVLRENKAMQAVFNNSGLKVESRVEGNVFHFDLDFE